MFLKYVCVSISMSVYVERSQWKELQR